VQDLVKALGQIVVPVLKFYVSTRSTEHRRTKSPDGTLAELKELEDDEQLGLDVHLGLVSRIKVQRCANDAVRVAIVDHKAQIPLHQLVPDILRNYYRGIT